MQKSTTGAGACLRPSSGRTVTGLARPERKNTAGSPLVLGPAFQGRHVQQLHPPPLQADGAFPG